MDLKKKLKEYIRIQVRELIYLIMLSLWIGIDIGFSVGSRLDNTSEQFLAFFSGMVILSLIILDIFIPETIETIKKEVED